MLDRCGVWVVLCVLSLAHLVQPAAHGQHTHGGGERTEDGAYSPKDHGHQHGGKHDVEFDHEAILGSKKDAYDFDQLPAQEAKKKLAILLGKMDRNGDKSIERQELYAWILRSFKSLSKEESDERFNDSDSDEDGFVTWKEYAAEEFDLDELEVDPTDPMYEEELQLMEEDRILFDAADINKDEKLDKAEFLAFSHPEEDDKMKPLVIDQVLKSRDKDKDGVLSFQEYLGERGEGKDKEWLLSEKDRFDTELDKNGDHHLSREEILGWIIPSNEETAEEEVNHLFAGADQDVNGMLSFQEIIDNHDLFVGSEATDYGEQLENLDRFDDEL
jgi:Ca2+-binding EF-hand superfamily protein